MAVFGALGALMLVLSAFGFSWFRDPKIRARAERPGWRLARPEDVQQEMDQGRFSPSKLRTETEAVALAKLRKVTLVSGCLALLLAFTALALGWG